jgi:hypothetical protein
MNQAIGKQHFPAEVRAANPQEGPAPFLDHLLFDHPRKMCVAPIVHVLVGGSPDGAPVNRRVTEQDADSLAERECSVQGSDLTQQAFVHRCRPDTGHDGRVLPYLGQLITVHRFACHVAIGDVLIPGIAELDDDVVDGAGKSGVSDD